MNDAMHAAYGAYLQSLADLLLLRDWEVELKREWADADAYAQACTFDTENHIAIRVTEGFLGHPPEERREWLTHELLHAVMARVNRGVARLGECVPDHLAVQLTCNQHEEESEIVVQQLARIIAPFLPLPPEMA
ncbi:MAG: hypothetical protein H0W42_12200 [Gemmatimonadaceae bacterium]|nr:hypothetical protein [Gemmatimonadaceae bacterium]